MDLEVERDHGGRRRERDGGVESKKHRMGGGRLGDSPVFVYTDDGP